MFSKKKIDEGPGKDITQNKFYILMDWVWKLFVINTLTLVTSFGIITFIPAIVSGYRTIKDCYEEDETHYIRRYYKNFAFCFKDTIWLGIVLIALFGMFFYAYIFYSQLIDALNSAENHSGLLILYSLLLSFTIFFFLIVIFGIIQIPMVVTYFHFRFFDKIKFCFYMAFKYVGIAMLEVVIIIADILLIAIAPIYIMVCFFSLPTFLIYLLSRRVYWSVSNSRVYEDEEDEYDIQGKTRPRETYEDNDEEIKIKEKELEELNSQIMEDDKDDKTRNR